MQTRLKVGEFVRFNHVHATKHGGLLSRETGLITAVDVDNTVTIVWHDGESSRHKAKGLIVTEGKVGQVVRAPNKPLADKGHKPVPTPPRIIPTLLPTARSGQYAWTAETVFWFVPGPEPTTHDEKRRSIRMSQRRLTVTHNATGATWTYTGSRRDGRWSYQDSRVKGGTIELGRARSLNQAAMDAELERMGLDVGSVWFTAADNMVKKSA